MAQDQEKDSNENLSKFISKNKKVLIIVIAVIVCAVVGYILGTTVGSKTKQKDLTAVDEISYALTNGSSSLEDAEVAERRETALTDLSKYTKKAGAVGVRANMLAAEISYEKSDYENAIAYWNAAAAKDKNAYTAPLAYFNAAACYEQTKNLDAAAENYKKAADAKDFVLASHAKFSYGRVLEAQGKYKEAITAYTELNDASPDDTWAKIAKSRILSLTAEGKAE